MCHALLLILGVLAVAGDAESGDRSLELRERARSAIIARRQSLDNLTVRFKRSDGFYPRSGAPKSRALPGGGIIVLKTEPEEYRGEFRYFKGKAMYSRQRTDNVAAGDVKRIAYGYSDDRQESLIEAQELSGAIERDGHLPPLEYIDIALGFREYDADGWLSDDTLRRADIETDGGNNVTLRWADSRLARVEHLMTFEARVGYALAKYERTVDGRISMGIENSDFKSVDNVMLPFKLVHTRYSNRTGEAIPSEVVQFNVEHYELAEAGNEMSDIRIEWPLGTTVADAATGAQVRVKSRPQKLDDETLIRAAAANQPDPPSSNLRIVVLIALVALTVVGLCFLVLRRIQSGGRGLGSA